jgi:hypothetical protein
MHRTRIALSTAWRDIVSSPFRDCRTRCWRLCIRAGLSRCAFYVCSHTQRAWAIGVTSRFVPLAPVACLGYTRSQRCLLTRILVGFAHCMFVEKEDRCATRGESGPETAGIFLSAPKLMAVRREPRHRHIPERVVRILAKDMAT